MVLDAPRERNRDALRYYYVYFDCAAFFQRACDVAAGADREFLPGQIFFQIAQLALDHRAKKRVSFERKVVELRHEALMERGWHLHCHLRVNVFHDISIRQWLAH